MKVAEIIEAMGGRPSVTGLTGVKASQISHMFTRNHIPSHHIRLFIALRPELNWDDLLNGNTHVYMPLLTDKGVSANRFARVLMKEHGACANV